MWLFISSILYTLNLCCLAIGDTFHPTILIVKGNQTLYKTEEGWKNGSFALHDKSAKKIVETCQKFYPKFNITNAVHQFKKFSLPPLCKPGSCVLDGHLIQCLNETVVSTSFVVQRQCDVQTISSDCKLFHDYKFEANKRCTSKGRYLADMNIFSPCSNQLMVFKEMSFVCCLPKSLSDKYHIILNRYKYSDKMSREHDLFQMAKTRMVSIYRQTLSSLRKNVHNRLKLILSNHHIDHELEILEHNFTRKYDKLISDFGKYFTKLDYLHFRNISTKSLEFCLHDSTICHKTLKTTLTKLIKHYDHMCASVSYIAYTQFSRNFKEQFSSFCHMLVGNKNASLRDDLKKMIQHYENLLKSKPCGSVRRLNSFEARMKEEFYAMKNKIQNSLSNYSSTITVVTIVIILLVLVLICVTFSILLKHFGNPLRRSTPNYVMTVVTDGDCHRSPLSSSGGNHSQVSRSLRLNLHENPIFNTRVSVKPMEKCSLIENMES